MLFNSFLKRVFLIFFSIQFFSGTIRSTTCNFNFEQTKKIAKQYIFFDQSQGKQGTLYCGCNWVWKKNGSSGEVDLNKCGYQVRKNMDRAKHIEWEHIVPVSRFGKYRPCWKQGGRKYCTLKDKEFQRMESDLYNIAPVIGEINNDRKNFQYSKVRSYVPYTYGTCKSKIDFQRRIFEPRDEVKGQIARVVLYMVKKYRLKMPKKHLEEMILWNIKYPVSDWEIQKSLRIEKITGLKDHCFLKIKKIRHLQKNAFTVQ
ncbi:endonuclease [Candidatus Riesia pediculischaeffi]|uniref:Uncharacterized protein n=2 Tax=Candidatus Riesia pediculischaeffi TaxID=428411 RepID=A0A1V0HKU0_9ENTR|nr:endonuclease [Candidatus Riesia pediculischaeffi]ARC53445.1 hypothetical protein AOQ87_02180 [Candidatus Riesia pediculischaeffi]KIE63982.1 Deoxyribonuclease I [Candidatus Riesia pediculischaeffi PTSU]